MNPTDHKFEYEYHDDAERLRTLEDRLRSLEKARFGAELDAMSPRAAESADTPGSVYTPDVTDPDDPSKTIPAREYHERRVGLIEGEIMRLRGQRDGLRSRLNID